MLCPIPFAIDKMAFDKHGHLTLEGVYMTCGLFNRETRNKVGAWVPLGYIPNLTLLSKNENVCRLKSKTKYALYHAFLDIIFKSFDELQKTGKFPFSFWYRNIFYRVNLKIFIYFVIGDTEGHDRMTGKYQCRQLMVHRICRHCNIPSDKLDDPSYPWQHTMPKDVQTLVDDGDLEGLQAISQNPINNAFYKLCCGGNMRNIHGMTFGETLHMIDLGLIPMSLEQFFIQLGSNPEKKGTTILLMELDSMARRIGHYLGHQSDRGLPRTYFPNGVTGGTKIAGHEYPGIVLVILIMCNTTECINLFSQQMEEPKRRKWIRLFELMLGWRTWLKQDTIPKLEMAQSQVANEHLIKRYTDTLQRK